MKNTQREKCSSDSRGSGVAMMVALLGLVGASVNAAVTAGPDDHLSASSTAPPAAGGADALAKKLANPVSAMISVPFQNNFDWGAGPRGDGFQWKLNIQPVIPFHLNDHWNLITRTIIPVVSQHNVGGTRLRPSGTQTGLSDTVASAWFSPAEPTAGGWIFGAGPALLLPTGTDDLLKTNQWGAGPTVIALRQHGKFTYGFLANHLWSIAGTGGRPGVNNTFVQPFFVFLPGKGWSFALNTESTYNWQADQWTIPINLMANKVIKIGDMMTQWQLGVRYYADKPTNGPEWGLRFGVTLLLPN